ncbi:MAG: hypothetical protein RJA99_3352 [Pseudomonadota bacterium]
MHYANPQSSIRRLTGLAIAAAVHVAIVYALVAGLTRQAVDVAQNPGAASIVYEVKLFQSPTVTPSPASKELRKTPAKPSRSSSETLSATSTLPTAPTPVPDVSLAAREEARSPIVASSSTPASAPAPASSSHVEPVRAPERTAPVVDAARDCIKPEYPAVSRRLEESGTVAMRLLVDIEGRVTESEIVTSSGYSRLDEAARNALSLCRFKPGTVDGRPQPSWVTLKYRWVLDN